MRRSTLVFCVALLVPACGSGVPYAKYETKVDENARLREENRSLERARGENDQLKRRVAELEAENRVLRDEVADARRERERGGARPESRKPAPAEPAGEDDTPAGAITGADVIQLEQKSSGTRVTVNRGSDHGVELGWTLQLVDAAGKPVPKARGKVLYVGPTYARAMLRVKMKVAKRCPEAMLIPKK